MFPPHLSCSLLTCHVPFRKKGDAAKEESKRDKRQRDKSKKDKERMPKEGGGRAVEEGEEEWQQVQGRTKEPFRDLRKAFFPNGLDKVEPADLLRKRGEVVMTRGKKVRTAGCCFAAVKLGACAFIVENICVCVCTCVCAVSPSWCMCACVCACVCVCVCKYLYS